jgi:hypothetical protein
VRQNGRIVSVAAIVAVGVNSDGRREILGMDIGPSEAETFWIAFLRKLARRGLRGVKLVISDAHEGIKAAVAKVLHATWQADQSSVATARSPIGSRSFRRLCPSRSGSSAVVNRSRRCCRRPMTIPSASPASEGQLDGGSLI